MCKKYKKKKEQKEINKNKNIFINSKNVSEKTFFERNANEKKKKKVSVFMAASVHCMRKVTVTRYTNVFGESDTEKKTLCVGEGKRRRREVWKGVLGRGGEREGGRR